MKRLFFIGLLSLFSANLLAENSDFVIKDIDGDGVCDTIRLDEVEPNIVCKLSSQQFKEIRSEGIEFYNMDAMGSHLSDISKGFSYAFDWMRAGDRADFEYEEETKRIRLVSLSHYAFGNAMNDGRGESSIDLLTGEYNGSWDWFDMEKEELIEGPFVEAQFLFSPIYLEDFSDEIQGIFADKCQEIYSKHLEEMSRENKLP